MPDPSSSQAAWLQRIATAALFAWAVAWCILAWGFSPVLAVVGATSLLLAHAWILGLEFLLLCVIREGDPVAPAPPSRMLRAWAREVVQSTRVFAWRQPWRWRQQGDWLPAAGEPPQHGIVLVHGFVCNRGFWSPWISRMRNQNRPVVAVNLEPLFAPIDSHVHSIEAAVQAMRKSTGLPPVVIGHSMGGLALRAWLRTRADALEAVAHVVTIATPHAGTWLARFSHLPNGRQMRQDSPWLRQLRADWPAGLSSRTICWHSDCDNVVMPPSTATMPGADNRLVPGAAHVDLAFHPEVVEGTLALLDRLDQPLTPQRFPAAGEDARRSA